MKAEIRMPNTETNSSIESRGGCGKPLYLQDGSGLENTVENEEVYWNSDADGLEIREKPGAERPRNLLERTARFGESVILFARRIRKCTVNDPLINQFVKSGTSVGANYCEADDPLSRKDYMKSIGICRKESKETKYWLRMVAVAAPELKGEARELWQEAKELNLIFGAIYRKK